MLFDRFIYGDDHWGQHDPSVYYQPREPQWAVLVTIYDLPRGIVQYKRHNYGALSIMIVVARLHLLYRCCIS